MGCILVDIKKTEKKISCAKFTDNILNNLFFGGIFCFSLEWRTG